MKRNGADKKLASVKLKSIRKRMKGKAFAAGVNDELAKIPTFTQWLLYNVPIFNLNTTCSVYSCWVK